ncbi:hypothetical protein DBB36_07290 [Flavobacterium sp. WLB]|uniref:Uncharacterized protein n=1 Tax=Flavobacterium panici TaxID=2654843 RepID=A0A9N8P396_9FLAO|nr:MULTISPECIES: hypothetical protein [Flavobacterium]KOP39669.1 hypothetical protein AKO67_03710 [Flavobacterium sp. VMW]OWU90222.1 hypothetical protein APR43_14190 [Flavobacterium sp. NLM]PUU70637.1 hypothetical protein DBB36_07290 [Flavobacterium sp. WLB]CAC9975975.1 hypothetical protein FLAPXU55_03696 [Flavobacterium panici]
METKQIKNLDNIKKLSALYFNTLKRANDEKEIYTAEIKFINYYELGCVIKNMLQLCILVIDQETHKISEKEKKQSINVGLILELVMQLFPLDEFEFLDEINDLVQTEI